MSVYALVRFKVGLGIYVYHVLCLYSPGQLLDLFLLFRLVGFLYDSRRIHLVSGAYSLPIHPRSFRSVYCTHHVSTVISITRSDVGNRAALMRVETSQMSAFYTFTDIQDDFSLWMVDP